MDDVYVNSIEALRRVGDWREKNKISLNAKMSKHFISGP